jgi:hypothetical protein
MKLRFVDIAGIHIEGLLMISVVKLQLIFGVPIGYSVQIPYVRLLLEKLLVASWLKKFFILFGTRNALSVHKIPQMGPFLIQLKLLHIFIFFSIPYILIISYQMCVVQMVFVLQFSYCKLFVFLVSPSVLRVWPIHLWFFRPVSFYWTQIIKLFVFYSPVT